MEHIKIKGEIGNLMIAVSDEGETTFNPGFDGETPATYINLWGNDLEHITEYAFGKLGHASVKYGSKILTFLDTKQGIDVELSENGICLNGKLIVKLGFKNALKKHLCAL